MCLEQIQKWIAILSSHPDLAAQFGRGEGSAKTIFGFELSAEEEAVVRAINQKQLGQFARSLVAKRVGELQKIFRRTSQLLGERFGVLYSDFLRDHPAASKSKDSTQALLFAGFLESHFKSKELFVEHDWIRYEAAWFKARNSSHCLIVRRFKNLEQMESLPKTRVSTRPQLCIWLRASSRHALHHFKWTCR